MTSPKGGRPRKPTALKLLQGTNRPDRASPAEPQYEPADNVSVPEQLSNIGQRFFRDTLTMTTQAGVTTAADKTALFLLALAYQELISCQAFIDEHGYAFNIWQRDEDGEPIRDEHGERVLKIRRAYPETALAHDAWRRLIVGLREFGLTPSSRAGVPAVQMAKKSVSKWTDF